MTAIPWTLISLLLKDKGGHHPGYAAVAMVTVSTSLLISIKMETCGCHRPPAIQISFADYKNTWLRPFHLGSLALKNRLSFHFNSHSLQRFQFLHHDHLHRTNKNASSSSPFAARLLSLSSSQCTGSNVLLSFDPPPFKAGALRPVLEGKKWKPPSCPLLNSWDFHKLINSNLCPE